MYLVPLGRSAVPSPAPTAPTPSTADSALRWSFRPTRIAQPMQAAKPALALPTATPVRLGVG
jgi:hypothetical protein